MTRKAPAGPEQASRTPSNRLKEAIQLLGVSQADVGRRLGVSPAYVCDVLHGRRSLTETFAHQMQQEYGIDHVWLRHGIGEMHWRLPPREDAAGGIALAPVPLLEHPCVGNPLESDAWLGSTHLLPRGLARPSAPSHHRYVLRVTNCAPKGPVRRGDLVLVENLADQDPSKLELCWCTALIRRRATVIQINTSHLVAGVQVWGRCLALVWRALSPLE